MTEISRNLEDTKRIAQNFLQTCVPNNDHAYVVGLEGDLGSGKTTFTQAIAELLKITDPITSPTFVIEKIYTLDGRSSYASGFEHFFHIDAYRLESPQELEKLNWKETLRNPKNLIFIEWPEKVATILPKTLQKISFKFIDESTREITIHANT